MPLSVTARTECRLCRAALVETPWLDLGDQPLANALLHPDDPPPATSRVAVARCSRCGHHQLTEDVDPGALYAGYPYRSGVSATFREHCGELVSFVDWMRSPGAAPAPPPVLRVLDVGANDGTLVRAFEVDGHRAVGVDPSPAGPNVVTGMFPEETAGCADGTVDVVTALNTLNAVDDVLAFAARVAQLLAPQGVWILEVPYLPCMLRAFAFDTAYAEHRNYWLVAPLARAVRDVGLDVLDVRYRPIHGGSIRVTVGRRAEYTTALGTSPWDWWELEEGYLSPRRTTGWHERLFAWRRAVEDVLRGRGRVAGYGAAAKATVQAMVGDLDVAYVVDDTPAKQGHRSAWGAPIVPSSRLVEDPPDAVVVFPWNFAEEIAGRLVAAGWTGPTWVLVPQPTRLHLPG